MYIYANILHGDFKKILFMGLWNPYISLWIPPYILCGCMFICSFENWLNITKQRGRRRSEVRAHHPFFVGCGVLADLATHLAGAPYLPKSIPFTRLCCAVHNFYWRTCWKLAVIEKFSISTPVPPAVMSLIVSHHFWWNQSSRVCIKSEASMLVPDHISFHLVFIPFLCDKNLQWE